MHCRNIPRQYNHALFSALAPATHVSEHFGPTNKKLRCHLPLVVPARLPADCDADTACSPLCSLTVAGEERPLEAGKCVVFDDSFLHEAENRAGPHCPGDPSSGPRVVLIVDVWHPDLSAEEVSGVRACAKQWREQPSTTHSLLPYYFIYLFSCFLRLNS
jgi:aspartate beta-hydroxylase